MCGTLVYVHAVPRPQRYGEPTVHVSVRLPESLVEELGTPLSEKIVERLQGSARAAGKSSEPATALVHPCPHPKSKLRQVTRGKRCLDCGETL